MLIEERSDSQIIFISEIEGKRRIPIMIGPLEAMAIERALKKQDFPRPLTHDLIVNIMEQVQCNFIAVRITEINGGTFFAELVVTNGDKQEFCIDCRPSDAIALLVRLEDVPLYVAENVFADAEL